jgi:hypothetical protein
MTDPAPDLDELLRRANPVDETRLPLPVDDLRAQLLYEKITGTPYAGGKRSSRRRFGTFMAAIAALVVLGSGAAYAGLRAGHVSTHLTVECYGQDRLDSPGVVVSATVGGPIAACAGAWEAGSVGRGPVPLLAACVAPGGVAAVFPTAPGADVCAQLGLTPVAVGGAATKSLAATSTTSPDDLFVEVRTGIVQSMSNSCLDSPTAKAIVQAILKEAGLAWTVTGPAAFPPDRPCASPAFDEQHQQVILVGIPRNG